MDHRSFKRQGLDQIPTIHLGAATSALENKGFRTEKGDINREIKKQNSLIQSIKEEIKKITTWIGDFALALQAKYDEYKQEKKEEVENKSELFNLYEYLSFYQEMQADKRQNLNRFAKQNKTLYDLKRFSSAMYYLKDNKLKTIADLQGKIEELKSEHTRIFKNIKAKTGRIENLNKCIQYAKVYKDTKVIYDEYQSMKVFKENFYKLNKDEIDKHSRVIKMIEKLSGKKELKPKAWQEEIAILEKEIGNLNTKSQRIKDEYQHINHIKYAVEIVNAEYGINLSIEIDKAIKRGDKPSIIAQIENYKKQTETYNKRREMKNEHYKKNQTDR